MRISLIIALLISLNTCAQDSTLYYTASATFAAASGPTPFWIYANQQGSVPMDGNYGLVRAGIYKVYHPNNPRLLQWSGGLQAVGSYGQRYDNAFISDAYVSTKIGILEILGGQQNAVAGIMDTTLTSGSLAMSGNARPFPKLQISLPNFVPIAITNGFIAFKASYADGYVGRSTINYGSVRHIDRTFLHQKTFYLRIGRPDQKWKAYAGFNHQAIWGGERELMPAYELKPAKAYWYMASGKTLDYRKIGNHFGTIDLAGAWTGNKWAFFVYRQSIFETGSLFRVTNYTDGLNGIRLRRLKKDSNDRHKLDIQSILFEAIGTKNQRNANPLSGLSIYENGNYFNHYIYRRGWSYKGLGMGTPLAAPAAFTDNRLPRNAADFTNNNRFWAFHTGLSAMWYDIKLEFKGTYSRTFGSVLSPFDTVKQQFSFATTAEKKINFLGGLSIYSTISSDIGKLYPSSSGILVGLRKNGFLD